MIDLYTFGTPNGKKVSIMLEELALPYRVHVIDILKGDQFTPEYCAINPNSKIPALVDPDGPDGQPLTIFESGAMLMYLAEKTGQFMPATPRDRWQVTQWLMWQMGGQGPMLGQCHHFRRFAPEQIPYAVNRYTTETKRLYGVLEKRLGEAEYVAGAYSIADMAIFPWVDRWEWQDIDLDDYPNVARWFDEISERPAVIRGMNVPK